MLFSPATLMPSLAGSLCSLMRCKRARSPLTRCPFSLPPFYLRHMESNGRRTTRDGWSLVHRRPTWTPRVPLLRKKFFFSLRVAKQSFFLFLAWCLVLYIFFYSMDFHVYVRTRSRLTCATPAVDSLSVCLSLGPSGGGFPKGRTGRHRRE